MYKVHNFRFDSTDKFQMSKKLPKKLRPFAMIIPDIPDFCPRCLGDLSNIIRNSLLRLGLPCCGGASLIEVCEGEGETIWDNLTSKVAKKLRLSRKCRSRSFPGKVGGGFYILDGLTHPLLYICIKADVKPRKYFWRNVWHLIAFEKECD